MYEDGYKFVNAEMERNAYLEADLYTCNEEKSKKPVNSILIGAFGAALGVAAGLALQDKADVYKYIAGAGIGGLLVLSFK